MPQHLWHEWCGFRLKVQFANEIATSGNEFHMTILQGRKDFEGATFIKCDFTNATIRFSDVRGMKIRSTDTNGLDIDDHDLFFGKLIVNGVDVVPYVNAELNKQFPGRELQSAQTHDGLREGWVAVQKAWQETIDETPEEWRDVQVNDEWSLSETLRHLILATNAWFGAAIQRQEHPFHDIGLIFTGAAEMGFDMSIFREDEPTWEEILQVRAEHQQAVTDFLNGTNEEGIAEERDNPWGGDDWHPTVGDCIRVILEEEWAHLRYIRRDHAELQEAASEGEAF